MDKRDNDAEYLKTSMGGKRQGAGRPKGLKWPSTLEKAAARELVRQKVTSRLGSLIDAQLDNAEGIRHFCDA